MHKPPQKARRDANEAEIVETLRAHGISVALADRPVDLVCGYGGKTWIAEVKVEGGKLTPAQKAFQSTWRGNWAVLRSVADAVDFAREMRGQE